MVDTEITKTFDKEVTEIGQVEQEKHWKIFLKQLSVVIEVWTSYFMYGLVMGAPTVFIPQLRREKSSNSTISEEMASWLSSAHFYSAVPNVIVLSTLAYYIGRKKTYLIVSITSLGGFLLLYFSVSVLQILISEIIQGVLVASEITLGIFIVTEYTSPTYRGVLMTLKAATFFWGVWIANTIGTFFHWRKIALLGIMCGMFKTIIVILSPESPYWLASKGRFTDCAQSHRWLKGCGTDAEKELNEIYAAERETSKTSRLQNNDKSAVRRLVDIICSNEFYKPILLTMLILGFYTVSGKLVCSVYIIDIIKDITDSEKTAYVGMLTLDGITVLCMYLGSGLTKLFKRRTLLLTASYAAITVLFTISVYLYLISLGLISENKYLSVFLLAMYSVMISFGPINMCSTIYGELVSIKYRSSMMTIIGMYFFTITAIVLKLSPFLCRTLKLYGVFLFYAVSSLILVLLLEKYLPETKDKTLQEIQDSLNKKTRKEEIVHLI